LVKVSFQIKIGNLIDSNIMQLLPIGFAKELVEQLMNPADDYQGPSTEPVSNQDKEKRVQEPQQPEQETGQQQTEQEQYKKHPGPKASTPQYVGGPQGQGMDQADVQSAQFQQFDSVHLSNTEQKNLDMLMDIPLKVSVELGRTKRTIKEILEISAGSVVELDKLAGEPVDIHVNEKLMAKGEVVVIDENFGVRVTDILSPKDRLSKLR
ncbi:flagellar motor switch phosphatase FliY, partial [Halobacillus sp. BBL2006]|uniref:flagellar motor switch phosphatase FliY n=1 Tax=Halobacillus sp. BBL2006 TaxID=1543706 RepID=UPI0005419B6D